MWDKLEKDFTVKNMPAFSRFSGTSYEGDERSNRRNNRQPQNNDSAKSTGLVIIGAGLVVIAAIVYLGYRFLILPAMIKTETPVVEQKTSAPTVQEPATTTVDTIAAPESQAEAVATSTETVTPEPENTIVLPEASDADNDGLSDSAELFLGTNPQAADSDNDSYNDKQEILGGYDPSGEGKLIDNRKLGLYKPTDASFALIYPSAWEVNAANPGSILFSAPDQSFIQFAYEDLEEDYIDILAWYRTQFSDTSDLTAERLVDSNFGPGIVSADGQIVYYLGADGRRVYVLSYIKSGETAPYLEIFKMMSLMVMKM